MGEYKKAEWLKKYIREKNLGKITEFNAKDLRVEEKIRPNFNIFCKGQTNQNLWFICHLDVVPQNDLSKWRSNPFELKIEKNRLYARGVVDNNAGICACVIALENILKKQSKPYFNVNLLFVSDEETGNKYGIKYILDNFDLFSKNDLIVVPDAGDENGLSIFIAEKNPLRIKFKILGKEAHSSQPDKAINAFRAESYFIVELDKLNKIFGQKNDLFTLGSTFEPTKKIANIENINLIPAEGIFFMDCRLLPSLKSELVLKEIDKIQQSIEIKFKVKIKRQIIMNEMPAPTTKKQAKIIELLKKQIKKIKKKELILKGLGGMTFASILRKKGLDVAVYCTTNNSCHCANEYCQIDKLIEDAKVFENLMSNK